MFLGYEMIMKMGYKPGHGIGKTESGRTEPINLDIKLDRQGLGKQNERKGRKNKNNIFNDKLDNKSMKDFRDRIAQKRKEQLLKTDLYKSQKICQKLDMQQEIIKPKEIWFWLPQDDENSDSEKDDDFFAINEKLEILTKYLREKYFYCIWCGVAFLDEKDLVDNCPGNERNDH